MKSLLLLIFLFMTATISSQTTVAVVESVIPKDWDPLIGEIMTAKISESLLRVKEIRLVDRTNMEALFKEQDLQISPLVSDRDAKIIGGLAGAKFIVVPRAAKLGKTFFLSARMIHLITGEVAAQVSLEGTGEWESFPGLAAQLSGKLGELFGAVAQVPIATPVPMETKSFTTKSMIDPPDPPQQAPQVHLKLWSSYNTPLLDQWITNFRKIHPDVTVEWEPVLIGRDDGKIAQFALNEVSPDLLIGPSDGMNTRIITNRLLPLDMDFSTMEWDPVAQETVSHKGRMWGVPLYVGNNLLVYINKKYLSSAPGNIRDYKTIPASPGGKGAVINLAAGGFFDWPWILGFTQSWGSTDQEATKKGFELLSQLRKDYWPDWSYEQLTGEFEKGKVSLLVDGDWNLLRYKTVLKDNLALAPLPVVHGTASAKPPITAFVAQIRSGLTPEKQKAAQDFLRYLASEESQMDNLVWSNLIPGLLTPGIKNAIATDPFLESLKNTQKNGIPYPKGVGNFWTILDREVGAYLRGEKTAQAAAEGLIYFLKLIIPANP